MSSLQKENMNIVKALIVSSLPGAHHDTQHISWQGAGKRKSGGRKRGNIPYSGSRHPSRPDKKEQ